MRSSWGASIGQLLQNVVAALQSDAEMLTRICTACLRRRFTCVACARSALPVNRVPAWRTDAHLAQLQTGMLRRLIDMLHEQRLSSKCNCSFLRLFLAHDPCFSACVGTASATLCTPQQPIAVLCHCQLLCSTTLSLTCLCPACWVAAWCALACMAILHAMHLCRPCGQVRWRAIAARFVITVKYMLKSSCITYLSCNSLHVWSVVVTGYMERHSLCLCCCSTTAARSSFAYRGVA
jgi:hypothetical protein